MERAYRLSFGGTRTKRYAPTEDQAREDARYWIAFGQMRVRIERRMPSGEYTVIDTITR